MFLSRLVEYYFWLIKDLSLIIRNKVFSVFCLFCCLVLNDLKPYSNNRFSNNRLSDKHRIRTNVPIIYSPFVEASWTGSDRWDFRDWGLVSSSGRVRTTSGRRCWSWARPPASSRPWSSPASRPGSRQTRSGRRCRSPHSQVGWIWNKT